MRKLVSFVLSLFLTYSSNIWSAKIASSPEQTIPTVSVNQSTQSVSDSPVVSNPESDSTTFLQNNSALSPSESITPQVTPEYLIETSLSYFNPSYGLVETGSGYPFEGFNQRHYTQPTGIGFYAQLLANIITGEMTSSYISSAKAKNDLNLMLISLLRDQKNIGYKGLMPWMYFDGTSWKRGNGVYDVQVTMGENANLSAALAATSGALLNPAVANDSTVKSIRNKIETFLTAQSPGYQFLFDATQGKFHQGWNFVNNTWLGGAQSYHDYLTDEFRAGILFVVLKYNFSSSAYDKLQTLVKEYTFANGQKLKTLAPFDGGAFQVLWPSLFFDETENPVLNSTIRNFIKIALDFSDRNNLPGFLSASYSAIGQYSGNIGIAQIAANDQGRDQQTSSIYTLGAARMFFPSEIDSFLDEIFTAHPDLISSHGIWEGIDANGQVVQEQIVTNVASFILGMKGAEPVHMRSYLVNKNLYSKLQSIYFPEKSIDIIAQSTSAFSWSDDPVTASQNGSQYTISSPSYHYIGTAFIEEGLNLTDKKLRLKYSSTTDIGTARLELKEQPYFGAPIVRHFADFTLENTGGAEREIIFDLPNDLGLFSIDEVLVILNGGTGAPVDIRITSLQAVPVDIYSLITNATNIFSWGNNQVTGQVSGTGYLLTSPQFYSSGTAFIQTGVDLSGGQLRFRYKSTTSVGNVTFELKQQTASGLVVQSRLQNIALANTASQERELIFNLPDSILLNDIDEVVMLISGGTGGLLNLTVTDLTGLLRKDADLIPTSQQIVSWGNGITGAVSGKSYQLSTSQFFDGGIAFIQSDPGINLSGKQLQIRYRSTTNIGNVNLEFKTQTQNGLIIQHVINNIFFENTAGVEREITIKLPSLVELYDIHEVVMLFSGGSGGAFNLTLNRFYAAPSNVRDVLRESTSKTTSGNNSVTGQNVGDAYRISSPAFFSSNTTINHNSLNYSGRVIRIRYSSNTNLNVSLELYKKSGSSYTKQSTVTGLSFVNTQGGQQELLVYLPPNTKLSQIDQIKLILSGGTGQALNLTLFDFELI